MIKDDDLRTYFARIHGHYEAMLNISGDIIEQLKEGASPYLNSDAFKSELETFSKMYVLAEQVHSKMAYAMMDMFEELTPYIETDPEACKEALDEYKQIRKAYEATKH